MKIDDGPTRTESEARSEKSAVDPFARTEAHAAPEPDDVDRSGEVLGQFRLESKLGEGGMGVVYAAKDLRLGRTVALKILPKDAVGRDDRRKRFMREARAASAVMHPSIAAVFEVGEHRGEVFLAMERVPGETLRAALRKRDAPFDVERALGITRDIARALHEAHSASVVHRDLKPENVMVTPDGQVKILDFGLAKRLAKQDSAPLSTADLATTERKILGTPGYMAPEQALGDSVDERTDLFSLGVILYELLTRERPFRGKDRLAVLMATQRDTPPAPSAKAPGVPAEVDRLVLRCLEKRPEDRFQSATELIAALETVLTAPEPARRSLAVSRRARKTPALVGLPAILAALLALGVVGLATLVWRSEPAWRGAAPSSPSAVTSALPAKAVSAPARAPDPLTTSPGGGRSGRSRDGHARPTSPERLSVSTRARCRGATRTVARWGVVEKGWSRRIRTVCAGVRRGGPGCRRPAPAAARSCSPRRRPPSRRRRARP